MPGFALRPATFSFVVLINSKYFARQRSYVHVYGKALIDLGSSTKPYISLSTLITDYRLPPNDRLKTIVKVLMEVNSMSATTSLIV